MLHGPKPTQRHAARLRRAMTLPEVLLWRELRRRPTALKFRRQHPAGRYVLDFFCASARLAIEIDGMAHDMGRNPERDLEREAWLRSRGVTVLRIPARDVLANVQAVMEVIVAAARGAYSSTTPAQGRGGPPPPPGEDRGAA